MIRPFTIHVDDDRLALLAQRLSTITWPNVPEGTDGHGIRVARVRELVEHWRSGFDWRVFEATLNECSHVMSDAGEYPLHLVHERAHEASGVPIVLLHGWPDGFLRYRKLIPRLVDAGHDIVVPSLPGFGFSGQPQGPVTTAAAATRLHEALVELGVERYAVHGGDWGSVVADELARTYPDEVLALHLTDVPFHKFFELDRATLTEAERAFVAENDAWVEQAVYYSVQSAEPLTLAYGLTDSPVGLLAWIADKFDAWSDEVDPDDVVGLAALTWLTNTTWSGMRLYADDAGDWSEDGSLEDAWSAGQDSESDGPLDVPTGFSMFPRDITRPPREYAERFYRVVDWHDHDTGGHFAATEVPDLLATDLVGFLDSVVPTRL
ncbi:alpha/beta fold hydrolase [Phycicoccus sp. BSK3Z-2]|uniref:Alpha/beta fold hydrolase n=1 Tax=Phycicoccus avicenniae TaxID=2828860 RepID=A0A941DCD1_9MICO|nr:epoxide hydrolase family protein [Phycicoccus avicenniae]MBR7743757.1 alpha/beta fold hydrolase [Phycicoccus avicenniae]